MSKSSSITDCCGVEQDDATTLHSIRSFWVRHAGAWPSEAALRFLIRSKRKELLVVGAVLSPPGIHRLLIDERRFLGWLRGDTRHPTPTGEAS